MASTTPDFCTYCVIEERTLVVCWSIMLATTEGDGGRGTLEAKERLVLGDRAATRALLPVSGSELSLRNALAVSKRYVALRSMNLPRLWFFLGLYASSRPGGCFRLVSFPRDDTTEVGLEGGVFGQRRLVRAHVLVEGSFEFGLLELFIAATVYE